MREYLPEKTRHPRRNNTRWLKYAIEKKIVNPIPATGKVLRKNGTEYNQNENKFGYKYIRVFMHSTYFSFYVHKCIYLAFHGTIPKGKELDHDDQDNTNNTISNIIARTTKQNMRKKPKPEKITPAFKRKRKYENTRIRS